MTTPIDISEQAGVRYLHFGSSWVQGAMRIARPWNLELEYTREMMASLLLRNEARWPRKILLIGLGAASLTKFLYRYRPDAHLTIVEIEPAVVAAARHFFKLPEDDKRIHMIIGCGAEYILGTNKRFDLILVDGFNEHAHPGQLNSLPFYQACRSRLTDQGIMAVNLLGLCKGVLGGFAHILDAFDDRALMFPSCERQHHRLCCRGRPGQHHPGRAERKRPRIQGRNRPESAAHADTARTSQDLSEQHADLVARMAIPDRK
jgi:spermidine synthase